MWDIPTMSTSKVDTKKRIVLPGSQRGYLRYPTTSGRPISAHQAGEAKARGTYDQKGMYGRHAQGTSPTDNDMGKTPRPDP